MTKLRIVLVVAVAALVAAGLAVAIPGSNFSVHATGDLEVPVRDTNAQGQATFKLSQDGESLSYKLNVANIENVIMAHIHEGGPTEIGDIVVWLYPSTAPGPPGPAGEGRFSGRIASGTITEANLVGPLAGADLDDLVELLQAGEAYVNVHTNDGVAPADTGPGDFPGGEVRGNF
jgi:hypothetical protein